MKPSIKRYVLVVLVIAFTLIFLLWTSSRREPCKVTSIDFNGNQVGVYTIEEISKDWSEPAWSTGVYEGRVYIVGEEKALRVFYPKNQYGTNKTGAQWKLRLKPCEELYVAYDVRFGDGFDFVKGGKLPGLGGGEANTGGKKPNGRDGWSARIMWREGGKIVHYVYHPDQPTGYGEDFPWDDSGEQKFFEPGRWQHVETRVVMNDPGMRNGIVQSWLDGELVLDVDNIRFRDTPYLKIDTFYFNTFFGGSNDQWATTKDEYILFDNFIISTKPIGFDNSKKTPRPCDGSFGL